jgi:predicted RNA-binding Zn ribbon-like protein
LCLDFVNTVGGRDPDEARLDVDKYAVIIQRERLNDYLDLLAWGLRTGVLTESDCSILSAMAGRRPQLASSILDRAKLLREAVYRICRSLMGGEPPRESDLNLLSGEIATARTHERLAITEGKFKWVWTGRADELDSVLWAVAGSMAALVMEADPARLRLCEGQDCGWLFEDTSRNRSRQWCTMEDCGNLAKVRRFRTRLRQGGKQ